MSAETELSPEITVNGSRDVDPLHGSQPGMDVAPDEMGGAQSTEHHEVVELQNSQESRSNGQYHEQDEIIHSDPAPSTRGACNNQEKCESTPNFLTQPLSFCWRRLKWGLILSLGRNDSVLHMNKEDMKAVVATQLEVVIMGSALVLTLCLQIQEVVGSRAGFTLSGRESARFVFVSFAALSFSFAFYAIITSAMMLLSINAVPQSSAEGFLTTLSSWSAIPRLCTLAGAFCLGIATLAAFFLGLDNSTAWVGVAVMGTAILLTVASTVIILIRVKRLQAKTWEDTRDSTSADSMEPRVDIENNGLQRKPRDIGGPSLSSPVVQPVLTPLSSLTNTTGFSIRTSRFR